ncbi:MAG: MlrC C-terminal domain-containing protein [Pseudomonadota bacterium]
MQDNPGGGGAGDTTGLLHALLDADAAGTLKAEALVVHIKDPVSAGRAHTAGLGKTVDGPLGGGSDDGGDPPVRGPFTVEALGDGAFTGEGPMYGGNAIRLGRVVLLSRGRVRVIVAERAMQASEPALLRHLGLDPHGARILVVKSAVHFRGAYGETAHAILLAKAPGRVTADPADLTYARVTRRPAGGVRAEPSKSQAA